MAVEKMVTLKRHKLESYDKRNNKPSKAWGILFAAYDIVRHVEEAGYYDLDVNKMMRDSEIAKKWREQYPGEKAPDNRNILKFDFSTDLPNIFKEYRLQIMPIGGNQYRIAPFNMYYPLVNMAVPVIPMASPMKMASLDFTSVTTEPNAQTVAEITKMLTYIFHDLNPQNREVVSTLSGKNNVHDVRFNINNTVAKDRPIPLRIETWQAEIDGVYESNKTVLVVESKMKFPKDFNIRQLFIPRLLIEQTMEKLQQHKDTYVCYFVKTKDVYIFTVYRFTDLNNMNSITLQHQYKFRLSDDPQNIFTIDGAAAKAKYNSDEAVRQARTLIAQTNLMPHYPTYTDGKPVSFLQANNLQVALDYLDFLGESSATVVVNDEQVARSGAEAFVDTFKYDRRQYNYYLGWLGYFGFIDRLSQGKIVLTEKGKTFNAAGTAEKNKILIQSMAAHLSSRVILKALLDKQKLAVTELVDVIRQEMKDVPAQSQISGNTLPRRISSVKSMCKQVLLLMGIQL